MPEDWVWDQELPLARGEPFDDGSFFDDGTGFAVDATGDWTLDQPLHEGTVA